MIATPISRLLALALSGVFVLTISACGSGARRATAVADLRAEPVMASAITTPGVKAETLETSEGSSALGKDVDPSVTRRFTVKSPAMDMLVEDLVQTAEAAGWQIERSTSGGSGWRTDGTRDTRLVIGSAPQTEGDASAWLTLIALGD